MCFGSALPAVYNLTIILLPSTLPLSHIHHPHKPLKPTTAPKHPKMVHTPNALKLPWSLFPSANHKHHSTALKVLPRETEDKKLPKHCCTVLSTAVHLHITLPNVTPEAVSVVLEKGRLVLTTMPQVDTSVSTDSENEEEYYLEALLGAELDCHRVDGMWEKDVLTIVLPVHKECLRDRTARVKVQMFANIISV